MPNIIASSTSTNRHGAFVIERNPPPVLRTDATGIAFLVGQFDWGPSPGVLVVPQSKKDFLNTFAPPGTSRTVSGYLSYIAKTWPDGIRIARVLGSGAAAASANLDAAGPTHICGIAAKYKGVTGNGLVATVSDASDGNPNHFNLVVSLSGNSGTTTDTLQNVDFSGSNTTQLSSDQLNSMFLVGQFTKLNSGRPANGTYTFTGGLDGTINSLAYVGTPGSGDVGIALGEGDPAIEHVVCDDCGSPLRAAVNAGLVAHAQLMTNRICYLNGDNGLSVSAVQADKQSYNHEFAVYAEPWPRILDDFGTKRDVPPGPFAAMVAANLSPSTSIAWKATEVGQLLGGIVELTVSHDASAGDNTDLGIATLVKQHDGSFRFEAGVNTVNGSNPAKGTLCRSRMLIYIARAWVENNQESIDAPNVPIVQQDPVNALDRFLSGLKKQANLDPRHNPYIVDYQILTAGVNSAQDIASGNFTVQAEVIVGPSIAKLILSLNIGETVTLSVQ